MTLITLAKQKSDFYDVPDKVNRMALDCMAASKGLLSALRRNRQRVSLIKGALRMLSPDVTISFCTETNVLVLLAGKRLATKIVVTEHLDPVKASYGRVWETLRRCTYPVADCLVSVSNGVRQGFSWMPASKNRVIYNPISVLESSDKFDVPAVCDQSKKWISSMGRLENQKGFDVLLDAIEVARERLKEWQVCIIGDGPLRSEIETKIRDLELGELVVLTGRLKQPHDLIRRSKIFVMASRFEGFPMAHAEALMCGVPVIATDCPSGPSEMVETGVNGILVPTESPAELAAALLTLIEDTKLRERMADCAPEITSRLGVKPIIKQWQVLFDQL